MSESENERLPHIVTDLSSRYTKADKIIKLLATRQPLEGLRVLEVGCGTGVLASRLREEVGASGTVDAVDRVDERVVTNGYRFTLVESVELPFDDAAFDIIVSNHVIEHVGTAADQAQHLAEMERVASPSSLVYLAGPNRWQLIEPHFRLPLLGWLPQSLADRYVRATRRGTWYDVRPPRRDEVRRYATEAGFTVDEVTGEVAELTAVLEGGSGLRRLAFRSGARLFELLPAVAPTQAVLLHKGRPPTP